MKMKIGTVMDENIVRKLKERSLKEGRSLSDVLQEALARYLNDGTRRHEVRLESVERFCSKPFDLKNTEIQKLLEAAPWES